jgi:hypothetical protein
MATLLCILRKKYIFGLVDINRLCSVGVCAVCAIWQWDVYGNFVNLEIYHNNVSWRYQCK